MTIGKDLLRQLPRFSEYDPGAAGEGSLDPIGLAALADRLADRLAPGVRARMSNPIFALLSAVGAFSYEPLIGTTSDDGKTTPDLAFEWLVVEALTYRGGKDALRGVPGSQKAKAAKARGRRLNPASYLMGPRIFGFNGVYRPFCQDSDILDYEGSCGPSADALLEAWEVDQKLQGFVSGQPGSAGRDLRIKIEQQTHKALQAGHAAASLQGNFYSVLVSHLAPQDAGPRVKNELRKFITVSQHQVRDELVQLLKSLNDSDALSESEVCAAVRPAASPQTAAVLDAVDAYESCATLIDHSFRLILATATAHAGAFTVKQAAEFEQIREAAVKTPRLASRALDALAHYDETLAHDAQAPLGAFAETNGATSFVELLLERHRLTQEAKGKRMWIDPVNGVWIVRPPYRRQDPGLTGEGWLHPMRIQTLISFLEKTR